MVHLNFLLKLSLAALGELKLIPLREEGGFLTTFYFCMVNIEFEIPSTSFSKSNFMNFIQNSLLCNL